MDITFSNFEFKGTRPMQDFHYVSTSAPWFGILCDGHGGEQAANETVSYMRMRLDEVKDKIVDGVSARKYFNELFYNAQEKLKSVSVSWPKAGYFSSSAGTTCTVFLVSNDLLHVAYIGDSKLIVGSSPHASIPWKTSFATEMHRVSNKLEEKRLFEMNATLVRCANSHKLQIQQTENNRCRILTLSLSRALGNLYDKEGILFHLPTISTIKIDKDMHCIIAATDGIWDVLTEEQVLYCARREFLESTCVQRNPAKEIVQLANYNWTIKASPIGTDNMTCVVFGLKSFNETKRIETIQNVNKAVGVLQSSRLSIAEKSKCLKTEELALWMTKNFDLGAADVNLKLNGSIATSIHSALIKEFSPVLMHELISVRRSKQFQFPKSVDEIDLVSTKYGEDDLKECMRYIYSDSLNVTADNMVRLSYASQALGFSAVKNKIIHEIVEKYLCLDVLDCLLPSVCDGSACSLCKERIQDFFIKNITNITSIPKIMIAALRVPDGFVKMLFYVKPKRTPTLFDDISSYEEKHQ